MIQPPPSVDDQTFYGALGDEDALGVVIRGVIYIESELNALLDEVAKHPAELKRMDLDFSGKVSLAIVLGLDHTLGQPLRALANIRNKFAHRPDAAITEQEASNLYGSLSGKQKTIVQNSFERTLQRLADGTLSGNPDRLPPLDRVRLIIVTLRQALRAARRQAEERLIG